MGTMKYTKSHEWVRMEGDDVAVMGITSYAQQQLGDVVFVELPAIGTSCNAGDEIAVVESVKAASEVYAPISGEIVAINQNIVDNPSCVNDDAHNQGWFCHIKITDKQQIDALMNEADYHDYIGKSE